MSRKTHHVIPTLEGGWKVYKGGSTRASKRFDKKQDAIAWGQEVSKKQGSELFIHKKDGTVESRESSAVQDCVG